MSSGSSDASSTTNPARQLSAPQMPYARSEEHTSELQSLRHLVCRLLLEKKKFPSRRASHAVLTYHNDCGVAEPGELVATRTRVGDFHQTEALWVRRVKWHDLRRLQATE